MAYALIKLTRGVPPKESFPTEKLRKCADQVLSAEGDQVLQYGKPHGYLRLRELIAEEKGVDVSRVLLGQGSLQLQDFCARLLVEPGDLVYVEEPTYDRALTILRRAKAHVVGIPLKDGGLDVDRMEERLEEGERPALFYTIPDFQNPSGTVLSDEERRRIVGLARVHGFWIISDVPYRRLRYRGEDVSSLFELAPDRVLQMSSYSKLISPGLRVGYLVAPEPLAGRLAEMAGDTYINASYLNQAIVAEFVQRDWLEPQISRLKKLYQPRLDATLEALKRQLGDRASWTHPDGGFFVGVTLDGQVDTAELLRRARDENLLLTDGRGFFAERENGNAFVRLPFCALTTEEIEEGIARLAHVVDGLS